MIFSKKESKELIQFEKPNLFSPGKSSVVLT